jgi:hypothetical protein
MGEKKVRSRRVIAAGFALAFGVGAGTVEAGDVIAPTIATSPDVAAATSAMLPAAPVPGAPAPVKETISQVSSTTGQVTSTATQTASKVTTTVAEPVQAVTKTLDQTATSAVETATQTAAPVAKTVTQAVDTAKQTVAPVGQTVTKTADTAKQTIAPVEQTVTKTVEDAKQAVAPVEQPMTKTVDTARQTVAPVEQTVTRTVGGANHQVVLVAGTVTAEQTVAPAPAGVQQAVTQTAVNVLTGKPVMSGASSARTLLGGSAEPGARAPSGPVTVSSSSAAPLGAARTGESPLAGVALPPQAGQGLAGLTAARGERGSSRSRSLPRAVTDAVGASSGVELYPLLPLAAGHPVREPDQGLLFRELGGVSTLWLGSLGFLSLTLLLMRAAARQFGRRILH